MDDRARYWLEIAEYDLETAEAMLSAGRYLYVGFMCHQVIEKSLKGLISRSGETPPYIHNLSKLADRSGVYSLMTDTHKDFLDALEPLNIQARYPEEKDRVSSALSPDRCKTLLAQTKELYLWIKAKL